MESLYYILSLYLTATLLFSLAMYAWWYRDEPVALPFALALVVGAIWPLTYGLELSSITLEGKLTWLHIRFLFLPYLPLVWLILVYTYLRDSTINDWRRIAALAVIPSITAGLSLVSSKHDLFRYNYHLVQSGPIQVLAYENGPWYWVHFFFNAAIFMLILGLLAQRLWQTNNFQRKQILLVVSGISLALVSDFLFQFNLLGFRGYNITPNLLIVSAVLIGIALFRFKLLSVVPTARNALVENMPDAVLVLDEHWRIMDANPAALRMLGLENNYLGQPIYQILPECACKPDLDHFPNDFTTELQLSTPSALIVSLRILSVCNQQGHITSRLMTLHDISAYRQAERALRDSQALYHTLVEAMPIGIFRKNLEGQYVFVNSIYCENLRQSAEEILGKTDAELFPEAIAQGHIETDQMVLKSGQAFSGIFPSDYVSPNPRQLELIKSAVRNAEGQIIGVQGVFWDVTERLQSEQEAQQRLQDLTAINAISQAIASQFDFQSLLELIAQKVIDILGVQSLYIALLDEKNNRIDIPFLLDEGKRLIGETLNIGEGLTSHILETAQPLIINQNYAETRLALGATTRDSAGTATYYPKSWVGVPILANEQSIGVIGASDYKSEHAFHEADIRLLSAIASNIGVAIQKARLYEAAQRELKERQQAEEMLYHRLFEISLANEVSQAASTKLDLNSLLEFAGKKIEEIFMAKSVFIALQNKQTGQMEVPYWTINHTRIQPTAYPLGQGLTSLVFTSQKPLLISEDFKTRAAAMGAILQFVEQHGYPRTWLGVPMTANNETIGVISVQDYERENAYSEFEINLLSTIANNIAISIENVRLYEKIRQDNIDLQEKIDEIATLQTELREQAIRDPLTNLFNRRYLEETLNREMSRANREKAPLCLIMLDIDHFKKLNDTYGHLAGDVLLRSLANLLLEKTRGSDIACRYGGEEFIVVMPGSPLVAARRRAEEIRQKFEKTTVMVDGHALSATVSLGVASYPQNARSCEALIRQADLALYTAKANGRNRVEISGKAHIK